MQADAATNDDKTAQVIAPEALADDATAGETQDNADNSLDARLSRAGSVNEMEELLAELSEPTAEASEPDEGDSEEDDDSQESEEASDEEDSEDDDEDKEDESESEAEAQSREKSRFRLRSDDPVERRAFELRARNPDLGIEDCLQRAKRELGVADTGDNEEGDGDDASSEANTPEAIEARIAELREQRKQARELLDMEKADDLDDQIVEMRFQLQQAKSTFEQSQSVAQQRQESEFNEQWDNAAARAESLYPDLLAEGSDAFDRMAEMDAALKESDDPRYYAADKPLRLAQMVAAERNIAPKAKHSPRSTKRSVNKPVLSPASGGARTHSSKNQAVGLVGDILKESDPRKLSDQYESLGIPSPYL